ncbi:hypothetical protein [Algoriphagus sp. A40]|uniref:PKD domain-containing protein n=1 Tax=Algoriphagus sp. A40 TaxID=1945863 RepID=UPI00111554C2|nr:hypothetical protein [Algoriphagus sp. A40]
MKKKKHYRSLGLLLLLFTGLFSACEETLEEPRNPLIAEAGEEQKLVTNSVTLLDGSQSINSTGEPISFQWELTQKPEGAEVVISALNQVAVQFSTDRPGEYVFKLTVTYQGWSDSDTVKIIVVEGQSSKLEAKAGEDREIILGNTTQLDATGSVNEFGGAMEFVWEIIQKPEGSLAEIRFPDDAVANFKPDKAGKYLIKLTVKVQSNISADLVEVIVNEDNGGAEGPILISGDILHDRVLENVFVEQDLDFDYIITKDIKVGARLTVMPGVRIGFEQDARMTISPNGTLVADAPLDNTGIVFQGKENTLGFWEGILVESGSPGNILRGVEIKNAGQSPLAAALMIDDGGLVRLIKTHIHSNRGIGVELVPGGRFSEFISCKIENSTTAHIRISAYQVRDLSTLNEIGPGKIQVIETRLNDGTEHIWPTFDAQYDILGDLVVYGKTTWVLSDGAHINMAENTGIRAIQESRLLFLGEMGKPVVIEGITKSKGYWKGIHVENSGSQPSNILWAEIRHAGSNPVVTGNESATLNLGKQGWLNVERTILDLGKGSGLVAKADASLLEFELNSVTNHEGHPIVVSTSQVEKLSYVTRFENNAKPEVVIDTQMPVDFGVRAVTWKGFVQRVPYLVKGQVTNNLIIKSGLRIEAGVILKMMPGAGISVLPGNLGESYLKLEGIQGGPVRIQGLDESAGSWHGIRIATSSQYNQFDHAEILHAGMLVQNRFSAAIHVADAPEGALIIKNSTIAKSGQHGIAVNNLFQERLKTSNMKFEEIAGSNIHIW